MPSTRVWKALPTPRGTNTAVSGPISQVKVRPNLPPDWPGFRAHVARTADAGLTPAVNMDTGYVNLIDDDTRLRVLDETRELVIAAMDELGYRPNSAARALKLGSFRTIGVISSTLSTIGDIRTIEAIAHSAAVEGYTTTLIPLRAQAEGGIVWGLGAAFNAIDPR